MRTAALLTGSDKRCARTRAARTLRTRALEDRLTANHTLRPASRTGLHGPSSGSERGWRWRRRALLNRRPIHGPGTGLRGDHAPLRNNRLLGCRFRRRSWSCGGRSSGNGRRWRGMTRRRLGRGWRCRWRRDHDCGRLRRRRLLRSWRSWRRRSNNRSCWFGGRRRHYRGFFWHHGLGNNDRRLFCGRRRGRCRLGSRYRSRRTNRSRWRCHGLGGSGWVLLLQLALLEQFENIARLGNLGEIDLGLNFRLAGPFLDRRRGLCRKMFAHFFGLVILKGA